MSFLKIKTILQWDMRKVYPLYAIELNSIEKSIVKFETRNSICPVTE